jgi:hypothetical protein
MAYQTTDGDAAFTEGLLKFLETLALAARV